MLAGAAAILFLLLFPFRRQEEWSAWALGVVSLTMLGIVEIMVVFANRKLSAKMPWKLSLALLGVAVLSLTLSLVGFLGGGSEGFLIAPLTRP